MKTQKDQWPSQAKCSRTQLFLVSYAVPLVMTTCAGDRRLNQPKEQRRTKSGMMFEEHY